jgi:protein-tyrosine phosphatase
MIDLHCHILPGLDDGAADMDEAVEMARIARADGVRTIVATPHVFRDGSDPAVLGRIAAKRDELAKALAGAGVDVKIVCGAEVYFSHEFLEEVRRKRKRIVINGSAYLFVEFPPEHVYASARDIFFDLMSDAVIPIIAHPERNTDFQKDPGRLYELVRMGALAQANSRSFLGGYGTRVRETVESFLRLSLVHIIASDAHSPRTRAPRLKAAVAEAAKIVGESAAAAMAGANPEAVIGDGEPPWRPDPVDPASRKKSVRLSVPRFLKFGKAAPDA